jgi:hypothetical protein
MSCDKSTSVYEQKEGIVLSRSSLPERIRHERHAQRSNIKHKQKELDTPRFERGFLTSVESATDPSAAVKQRAMGCLVACGLGVHTLISRFM